MGGGCVATACNEHAAIRTAAMSQYRRFIRPPSDNKNYNLSLVIEKNSPERRADTAFNQHNFAPVIERCPESQSGFTCIICKTASRSSPPMGALMRIRLSSSRREVSPTKRHPSTRSWMDAEFPVWCTTGPDRLVRRIGRQWNGHQAWTRCPYRNRNYGRGSVTGSVPRRQWPTD